MKLVYFGTAEFAVPSLEAVAEHVVLVVSQPDRPTGRGLKVSPSPVKLRALELGLPVETPEKSRAPEFVERLRELEADALLVAAYGQILSTAVLNSAREGGINLHGSVLPAYRGAAPIQRCLLQGDSETGVTLMQMDKGMDTGDMIAIRKLTIGTEETYGELQIRLAALAAEMAAEWLPKIVAGGAPRVPQDHERATMAPKVEKAEAELSPLRSAKEEHCRYRAFTPAPGAFMRTSSGLVKVHRARLCELTGEPGTEPGTVLEVRDGPIVAFQHGSLEFLELQPEGKKRTTGRDYANGARLKPGSRWMGQ
jgi:methionyl-tRNA formyltransferase